MLNAERCTLFIVLSMLLLTGCSGTQRLAEAEFRSIAGCREARRLTEAEARAIAAQYQITAPIVWWSERQNPWTDGYVIYIDLDFIFEHNLPLGPALRHEQYHCDGYDHCGDPGCLMYWEYQAGMGEKVMCKKCKLPTTSDWIRKSYQLSAVSGQLKKSK